KTLICSLREGDYPALSNDSNRRRQSRTQEGDFERETHPTDAVDLSGLQSHPPRDRLRAGRQGLDDEDLPGARRDRGALLRLVRDVRKVLTLLEGQKGRP